MLNFSKLIYIVVNPNSGSFNKKLFSIVSNFINSTFDEICFNKDIKSDYLNELSNCIEMDDIDHKHYLACKQNQTIIQDYNRKYQTCYFITDYVNHAMTFFSQLTTDIICNIDLIIMIGGDGIIHEVVNGLFSNPNIILGTTIPKLSVCPMGTGNHLAKFIKTETIKKFYDSLTTFANGFLSTTLIMPIEIVSENNLSMLSINTVTVGIPAIINERATQITPYLPSFFSTLKYEIGTIIGLFEKEYLNILTEKNEIIKNIIGVFVQTTPSCGNNFVVDDRINGSELNLTYAYVQDVNTCSLAIEFTKEKLGYRSTQLIRRYCTDFLITIDSSIDKNPTLSINENPTLSINENLTLSINKNPTLSIDGQKTKLQFPIKIIKSNIILSFLNNKKDT